MYKSPIETIYGEFETQMVQEEEKMVIKAVRKVGVNVDKDELISALRYDRNQYTKGYEDGKNEVLDKIRAEIKEEVISHSGTGEEVIQAYADGLKKGLDILDKYRAESEELSEHEKFILSQMVNSDAKTIEEIGLMRQKQLSEIYQHCGCQKIEPQESEEQE